MGNLRFSPVCNVLPSAGTKRIVSTMFHLGAVVNSPLTPNKPNVLMSLEFVRNVKSTAL